MPYIKVVPLQWKRFIPSENTLKLILISLLLLNLWGIVNRVQQPSPVINEQMTLTPEQTSKLWKMLGWNTKRMIGFQRGMRQLKEMTSLTRDDVGADADTNYGGGGESGANAFSDDSVTYNLDFGCSCECMVTVSKKEVAVQIAAQKQ